MPVLFSCIEPFAGNCPEWQGFDVSTGELVGEPIPGVVPINTADLAEAFTVSAGIVISLATLAFVFRIAYQMFTEAGEI